MPYSTVDTLNLTEPTEKMTPCVPWYFDDGLLMVTRSPCRRLILRLIVGALMIGTAPAPCAATGSRMSELASVHCPGTRKPACEHLHLVAPDLPVNCR